MRVEVSVICRLFKQNAKILFALSVE